MTERGGWGATGLQRARALRLLWQSSAGLRRASARSSRASLAHDFVAQFTKAVRRRCSSAPGP